jgi:cytochrome c oxidase cbb3-type subunit 3
MRLPLPAWLLAAAALAGPAGAQHIGGNADLAAGRRVYVAHCASCHGSEGEGGRGPTLAQPQLVRARDDNGLRRIIREGIAGTEMPRARLEANELAEVVAYVKALGERPREVPPGDPGRGRVLYHSDRGGCASCHSVAGRGGAIGPDLSDIGARRSVAYLRRALTDPGAEVPQSFNAFRNDVSLPLNYLFLRAVPRNGEAVAGVRVNEDTFSVQIRDLGGRVHSFAKAELAALEKLRGYSLMPPAPFAGPELDDLVAYLASLRSER